ncbi:MULTISPECIES: hypothetical protein [unclassified Sphingomonas]|jgi:hypothetical protein|uniref:hypothetical protein n=1 Tax=unclassified Sphingomonas TaxID=196159 RepID=UPI0007003127|nr:MULTISPECIES: hypothetical protein [unclassified Sphingomonas]KQN29379.1 hypothetical protein ASE88_10600 [Sphingomonas sp. Leaf38]KQN31427.1 hypothetical protein ASF00_01060 [Sphingomonas sp. Leaf34]
MPVAIRSRYATSAVRQAPDRDGTARAMLPARLYDTPPAAAARSRHALTGTETLETLSWRYGGTSDGWWRVADANRLAFPLDWRAGEVVDIVGTNDTGRIVRDRRF